MHWPSCSQGLPRIYNRDHQGPLYLPQDIPLWGRRGRRRRYRRQDSKGLLQRSPGHSVNGSSQAAKENGKGGEKGREAGELGRHSSSCNFRICGHICVPSSEKKIPPKPHHSPATVCLTQSSRTLKKPKVLLHPFGEEGG